MYLERCIYLHLSLDYVLHLLHVPDHVPLPRYHKNPQIICCMYQPLSRSLPPAEATVHRVGHERGGDEQGAGGGRAGEVPAGSGGRGGVERSEGLGFRV